MSKHIDELIETKVAAIKEKKNIFEVGRVSKVQNYILEVDGLENIGFFEKVTIEDKAEGYVSAINQRNVVVAVTKKTSDINIGDAVKATGKEFRGLYSPYSIGHIVDMFAEDKLTSKRFDDTIEIPISTKPIPIMDRGSVNRPLLTGITGIDMIYPVGCGQRQLIIGDKKTGKTQIVLDTIVNQKDKDILCIYIAIGKTKKEVKEVYAELLRRGAMEYTIILAAFNDECPPVLTNTPAVGLAIAEHYMLQQNIDVLVAIDDLKRHADVYREISLLTGKVPGRDAYPSDMFYTHASLLEKGCQHKNGGSITILPIIETKGGDITDYISSNVISITDGQIVLSTKNFEDGQKPAIDYGLSVSRLGGAVQTKEIKKIGAVVRRELLSYLETCDVYELANMDEMSPELRNKMLIGKEIRNRLIQYKFSPWSIDKMSVMFNDLVELD
ncbi:F0F1 ATP synthase subunit alpha [Lachnospiraceae bacterium MD1]|uniref:F0F1 ATP synthase subunit alpha n=1 Tax=Variimorphobacter saccharofermentans TaxID=2755051 RepID=A0A839JY07_9FIRM|nr:F0F1 ATP synthase subunit alpha [Variimorphobacter saccharofermentans]MBB2182286.1 F0F1 ATP synthase subunit alpha [Variimorphobacter saccharofermentans]